MSVRGSTNFIDGIESDHFWTLFCPRTVQAIRRTSNRLRRIALIIFAVGLMTQVAVAADLELSGNCSWQISGSTINISAGQVSNKSTSGASGSIRLQIWATGFPYTGGTISGYVLGTRSLNPLSAGYYYTGIVGSVSYLPPPSGSYYTTLTVEEFTGSSWVIRDYLTFPGTSQLGGAGGGAGSGAIELGGTVAWTVEGARIDIRAGTITNRRTSGTSGSLRLQIWATPNRYSGGSISGYVFGTRSLGTLAAGNSFSNVSGFVTYTAPPAGTYYTTITLEEFTGTSYSIVDYVTFDSTTTIGSGSPGSGAGSGNDLHLLGKSRIKVSPKKGVNIKTDQVFNSRASGISGSLRLQLWATATPYQGGEISGYVLATRDLPQLAGGSSYYDISGKVPYARPPKGTYYLTLTLEEYGGKYNIADYVNFPKRFKVK